MFTVSLFRKMATMMARPTAASAAATVITKKAKTCPRHRPEEAGVGQERQVDGVQHQLDAHEDDDCVPAREHARHANEKEDAAQRKVVVQRSHGQSSLRLARTTAPTIAARMRMLTISKGKRKSVKRSLPISAVVP